VPYVDKVVCSDPACGQTHSDGQWGKIKAGAEGWFFQKDGNAWCPAHIPDWVAEWRARNAQADKELKPK